MAVARNLFAGDFWGSFQRLSVDVGSAVVPPANKVLLVREDAQHWANGRKPVEMG